MSKQIDGFDSLIDAYKAWKPPVSYSTFYRCMRTGKEDAAIQMAKALYEERQIGDKKIENLLKKVKPANMEFDHFLECVDAYLYRLKNKNVT